jgi:hypothetical protein
VDVRLPSLWTPPEQDPALERMAMTETMRKTTTTTMRTKKKTLALLISM